MLETKSLFFASVPNLWKTDKWEAAFPETFLLAYRQKAYQEAVAEMRKMWEQVPEDYRMPFNTDGLGKQIYNQTMPMRIFRLQRLERTFVNCCHVNDYESAAMWKLYSAGAYTVAIRSAVRRLKTCLADSDVQVHSVQYIDYSTEIKPWNDSSAPLFTKRRSFQHENELRAVKYKEDADPAIAGLLVPADIPLLMEAVCVSPYDPPWFAALVRSLLSKYGMGSTPVETSRLNEEPSSI